MNAGPVAVTMALIFLGCGASSRSVALQPSAAQAVEPTPSKVTPTASTTMRTPEEQRDFDLLNHVTDAIEKRVAELGYAGLGMPEKTIYTIWWLEAEVNNGGFDQYFFNSAGDHARDAPAALSRIGAPRTADLVREVNALFPAPGPSTDRATRGRQLEGLKSRDKLEAYDDRFYQYPENLERLLAAFARAHRDDLPGLSRQ
jgi:hypothetical protein